MAAKLAVEAKRRDMFYINPFDVELREDLRGRHKPPTLDRVTELAVSLMENGQLQPSIARRTSDKKLILIAGFTRCNAARLIREGFEHEGKFYQDENFQLQIVIRDCNDQESFVRNVVENAHRDQTSYVDDAFNQRRLRDSYGMTNTEIARLYGCTPSHVSVLSKVCQMDTATQAKLHAGDLALSTALDLLDLPEEEREKMVEASRDEVREAVRQTTNKVKFRSVKEARTKRSSGSHRTC